MKNFFVYMYNTIIKLLIGVVPLSNWRKRLRKKLLHKTAFPSGALFFEIKRKKEQLLPLMKHIDTLFLGSSHVAYAFNPQYYSGTSFNLGSNSQDFFTSFSLLEKLVGDLPKLEKVFLGYDIFSRGWNLSKSSASFICASYDFLYNIEYLEKNYTQKDILRCAVLNKKKSVRKDKIGMGGGNGFLMPLDPSIRCDVNERIEGHLKNYYRQDSQEFLIKKILDLLDRRNVSLYLVLMPVKNIYREAAYSRGFNFGEVYQLAEKLKIKCINFFDDAEFIDSDFYDFDHLNFEGSKKFSEKLKNYFLLNNKMS